MKKEHTSIYALMQRKIIQIKIKLNNCQILFEYSWVCVPRKILLHIRNQNIFAFIL